MALNNDNEAKFDMLSDLVFYRLKYSQRQRCIVVDGSQFKRLQSARFLRQAPGQPTDSH